MFKANIGQSIVADSFTSGQETIKNALKDMENPKVALVFSSEEHEHSINTKARSSIKTDLFFIVMCFISFTS